MKNASQNRTIRRREFLRLFGAGTLALSASSLIDGCGSSGGTVLLHPAATGSPKPVTRYKVGYLFPLANRSVHAVTARRVTARSFKGRQASISGGAGWNGSINDKGEVAGYDGNVDTSDIKQLVLKRPGADSVSLGVSGADLYEFVSLTRINDSTQIMAVVGRVDPGSTTQETFTWQSGTLTSVFGPASIDSAVQRVGQGFNDSGVLLFSDYLSNTLGLWKDGAIVYTSPVGYYAGDINNAGQILALDSSFTSGIFDPSTDEFTALPTPSGPLLSFVTRLNNSGQAIAGGGLSGATATVAWWHDNLTQVASLGVPADVMQRASYDLIALDLNDQGVIVGSVGGTFDYRALIWRSGDQTPLYLDTLIPADSGWTLTWASGVNNAGQIIGEGTFQSDNGAPQTAAFLLTPDS